MKEKILAFFSALMFLAGLSLLLYPSVSDYLNTENHRRAIYNYLQSVETLSDEDYERILAEAENYNKELAQKPLLFKIYDNEQKSRYESALNLDGNGLMGSISIEKADIYLPIYHGTSEQVLQSGVGHIEGSSLPVGGETSHILLSGHRGLPAALLFTNLDKLEIGDTFTLMVLNESYIYEVDKIQTIQPEQGNILQFEKGQDYCTLITCTPYGINTQRLLVRGKRLVLTPLEKKLSIQSGAKMVNILLIIGIIEFPLLIISASTAVSAERRRFRRKS